MIPMDASYKILTYIKLNWFVGYNSDGLILSLIRSNVDCHFLQEIGRIMQKEKLNIFQQNLNKL